MDRVKDIAKQYFAPVGAAWKFLFGRIKRPLAKKWHIILGILGCVFLGMFYSYLSHRQKLYNPDDTTMPSFVELFEGFKEICTPEDEEEKNVLAAAFGVEKEEKGFWGKVASTWLFKDATATYGRLFKGLMWGCFLAVVVGVLMGCYEWLAALLVPPLSLLAQTPATAMIAVFYVLVLKVLNWNDEMVYVMMIGFGVFPTLVQTIYLAARDDLHPEEIDKAYTLGASNSEVIVNVVFPQIIPKMIDSIRLQIGPAMVYLIAAEMLLASVGMGYQIRMQQRLLHMAVVYNYLFILGFSGLLMNRGLVVLGKKLCAWFAPGG
jgi:NitT/TauT family transport system permease protein